MKPPWIYCNISKTISWNNEILTEFLSWPRNYYMTMIIWVQWIGLRYFKKIGFDISKLSTVVKVPFSIATTPRCRDGAIHFPGLSHFTLDTNLIMQSVKQGRIKYHFLKSLVWLDLGLNAGLPDHWWTLYPLDQWAGRRDIIIASINCIQLK